MKQFCFLLLLFVSLTANAQMSGNHVYGYNHNDSRRPNYTTSISSTDTTLTITANVLLTDEAEEYIISLGINQLEKTVPLANQKLNDKIKRVSKKFRTIGIPKKDIYVDFIAETKMYDYKIEEKNITEYLDGFSIRKNLIVKTKDLNKIEQIIDFCAEEGIYDIIKIDYVSKDLEDINETLFAEAMKIIEKKKNRYNKYSSIKTSDRYRIVQEHFNVYYPANMYKKYNEAYETSSVQEDSYNRSYIKKEMRKERTVYYDGIEKELGVNKIIDKTAPKVGIQYQSSVTIIYELER